MTLNELIQEVYSLTNRPDLINETLSAVKAATLKVHGSDFYFKDLFESGVDAGASSYIQSIDLKGLISNYRSLKYIRKYDAVGSMAGRFLDIVNPGEILDDYGIERQDIAYEAGRLLQVKMSTQEQYFLFGCYLYPIVTTTGYTSWIADEYPYSIVFDAVAKIYGMLQKTEARDYYASESGIVVAELKGSNIDAVGN